MRTLLPSTTKNNIGNSVSNDDHVHEYVEDDIVVAHVIIVINNNKKHKIYIKKKS